jgi:hypothetical protein
MARPKKRKSTYGATALALPPRSSRTTGKWSLPISPNPESENDITYFVPLYIQTVATLGFFPTHITADAAFDAWYIYQLVVHRGGMAAIALNQHGHPECQRAPDGVPLCPKGLRMHPTYQFAHTYGYRAQRFRCPLLFPHVTGETCDHEQ